MSNWITHMMIADRLLEKGLDVDERAFCIGCIAPDCNVENEDWTAFDPPREATHWMTGSSKLTADYEGFYRERIEKRPHLLRGEYSFLLGYYVHLVTDVESMRFYRDENRVRAVFERLGGCAETDEQTFDTLKKRFGKEQVFRDIVSAEERYVLTHPQSVYHTVLRRTETFPDEWAGLPSGAIGRKVRIMAYLPAKPAEAQGVFFPEEEIQAWINQMTSVLEQKLQEKMKGGFRQ